MSLSTNERAPETLSVLGDAERLQTIERSGLVGQGGDPALDRLARLAARLVGAPQAFVTLVTPDGQTMPGVAQLDKAADTSRARPLSASLCQFAVATGEPLVIPDASGDPLVRDMVAVRTGQIGAYAGVPLRTSGGHVLGTLCLADHQARTWTTEDVAMLEDLTAIAAQEVQWRLASERERRLRDVTDRLAERMGPLADAAERLVELAEEADDVRLPRYAALTRSRLEPVERLTAELERVSSEPVQRPASGPAPSDLRRVVARAVRSARAATGTECIEFHDSSAPLPGLCDAIAVERSVTHVLVSALHHSSGGALVHLRLSRQDAPSATAGTGPAAELLVVAQHAAVPAGELARIVSRLAATASTSAAEAPPSSIRVRGSRVSASSGQVRGECATDGGLRISVRWELAKD